VAKDRETGVIRNVADPVQVLLDATVLVADWRLGSNLFRVLRREVLFHRCAVFIPDLVIREVQSRYAATCERAVAKMDSGAALLRRVGATSEGIAPALDIEQAGVEYGEWLRKALRQELRATIVPTPTIPADDVIDRAIERRRPFDDEGRGYRDTLIWLSALEMAKDGPVVLISADKRAFYERNSETELHGSLVRELAELGLPIERVSLYLDLGAFADQQIAPLQETLDQLGERYASTRPEGKELRQEISAAVTRHAEGFGYAFAFGDDAEAEVEIAHGTHYVKIFDAFRSDEDDIVIRLEAETEVDVNYAGLPTALDYRDRWRFGTGSQTTTASIEADATVKESTGEVQEVFIELLHLSGEPDEYDGRDDEVW
jgi:PIN domain-containing protein